MTTTALRVPTWIELVQAVAAEFGETVDLADADYLLWEYTGFPSFWPRADISAAQQAREQLRDYFKRAHNAPADPPVDGEQFERTQADG